MKMLLYMVGFFAFFVYSEALNCRTGYEVESQIISDTNWESMACPEDDGPQMCLRFEGAIIIFGAYRVNTTTGACVSRSVCEQECQSQVDSTIVAGFARAAVIDPKILTYELVNCKKACCSSDNCNQYNVEQIEEMQRTVTAMTTSMSPRVTSTPITTTNPTMSTTQISSSDSTLVCSEGFSVFSEFLVTHSWNETLCRSDLGHRCIRGEGIVVVSDVVQVNVSTAFCANQSSCEESCVGIFQSVLADLDPNAIQLRIESCLSACCDTNKCNNLTISEIQNLPSKGPTPTINPAVSNFASRTTVSIPPAVIGTASPDTLNCISGYSIESSILNESTWNLAGCAQNSNQRCIRSEIDAILFNNVNVTLVTGSCVERSICELSCEELTRTLLFSPEKSTDNIRNLNLDSEQFFLRACRRVCCDYNNCNNRTVEEIVTEQESVIAVPTILPPAFSIEPPALECHSGYIADSDISNDRVWPTVRCSAGPTQRCIRAEATATVFEIIDVRAVVGFCVDVSECDERVCNNFIDFFRSGTDGPTLNGVSFRDDEFVVNSCQSICCTGSNCNNNPIPRSTAIPSTTTTPPSTTPQDSPGTRSTPPSFIPHTRIPGHESCVQHSSCSQDENTLFVLSLVPRLNSLPRNTASEVKMRMMELLHEAEFGNLVIR